MRGLLRLAASASTLVVGAGATAVLLGPLPAATAAPCPTGRGVTVVADMSAFGQGVRTTCDTAGASKSAAQLLDAAYGVTYVQRQPGFLCRIAGVPAEDPCVNTPPSDAYWGLFHSDGRSGTWVYSTVGAGGLRVPDGGYVAVAWQDGTRAVPGVAPAPHAAPTSSPEPTPAPGTPTKQPAAPPTRPPSPAPTPTATPGGPTPPGTPTPTPTGEPSAAGDRSPAPTASVTPKPKPTPRPGARSTTASDASDAALAVSEPQQDDDVAPAAQQDGDTGLPTGVVLALLLAVVVAALVGYRRRRPGV